MSDTQFAMVEELASLVRDNVPCKHLILSMEEMLVNFIQDDGTSLDGVLELEPMNPYNRLLIHRLAEIFGFSHKSIGEGEDRHLILERCPETSIPSILVSDLLWHSIDVQSPMVLDIFKQKVVIQDQRDYSVTESSLEERRTAYLAARERIFSEDACDVKLAKNRPRHDPVVARRMITRALGRTNKAANHEFSLNAEYERAAKDVKSQLNEAGVVNSSAELETKSPSAKHPRSKTTPKVEKSSGSKLSDATSKASLRTNKLVQTEEGSAVGRAENQAQERNLRNEHVGTAKRLFANALGIHRKDANPSSCNETKKTDS
ncbi:uncharacterized protein [Primulina huaijiensis]|uniref:uncharacterized protein isoform X1 n=2 Tax=Primulina huaijiensis TaxID=1492673 RepID=UPI003CC76FF6